MTRVLILPQRDLLGQITEYVIALDYGHFRLPIAQRDRLPGARREAKALVRERRASRITIETDEEPAA